MAEADQRCGSQQEWRANTNSKVDLAKSLTKDLLSQLSPKALAGGDAFAPFSPKLEKKKGPRETVALDSDLLNHANKTEGLDSAVQRLKMMCNRLQHQAFALYAPLQVCEWRLGIWDRRPSPECFKDNAQIAMEAEKEVLTKARTDLTGWLQEGNSMLKDLYGIRDHLEKNRREIMNIPGAGQKSRTLLMERTGPLDSNAKNAHKATELAVAFLNKTQTARTQLQDAIDKAGDKTVACLEKHIAETLDMKNKVESQLAETYHCRRLQWQQAPFLHQRLHSSTSD